MRTPEQQIQAALGISGFRLDNGSLRKTGRFFAQYAIELPSAFQHGLPPHWRFSALSTQAQKNTPKDSADIVAEALQTMDEHRRLSIGSPVPLIILCDDPSLRLNDELGKELNRYNNVFFMDQSDFRSRPGTTQELRSAPFLMAIRRGLNRQQSAQLLSPYTPGQPVSDWRFFGRQKELQRIITSPGSYMVVGARRIGKTSLLKHLDSQLAAKGAKVYYLNVQDCNTEDQILNRILNLLEQRDLTAIMKRKEVVAERLFYLALRRLARDPGVVLLLDELGNVLMNENADAWSVIGTLRTFAQSGRIRIIASAFQEFFLRQQRDFSGPWVNFFTPVLLSGLSREELREFVILPLSNWASVSNPSALLDFVITAVGQHPLALQYFCQALFEAAIYNDKVDLMYEAKRVADVDVLKYFRDVLNQLFYDLPSTIKYLYLWQCHRMAGRGISAHQVIFDDDVVDEAMRQGLLSSTTTTRRNLLINLELRGLTQPEADNPAQQRVTTPILYRALKRAEGKLDRYLEKLRAELPRDAHTFGLELVRS